MYVSVLTCCTVQKEKEDLDDVSNELELADEEAMIPLVYPSIRTHQKNSS